MRNQRSNSFLWRASASAAKLLTQVIICYFIIAWSFMLGGPWALRIEAGVLFVVIVVQAVLRQLHNEKVRDNEAQ